MRDLLRTIREYLDHLGSIAIIDGEFDHFTPLPDIHEPRESARNHGGIVISQHSIEPINEARVFDKISIMIIQFRNTKSRRLPHVRI